MTQVNYTAQGDQGIGLVCKHIAVAVNAGARVGFFWGDGTDTARPDAWCLACEQSLLALNGQSSERWFRAAEFKIFCAMRWDEAKAVCGGFSQ